MTKKKIMKRFQTLAIVCVSLLTACSSNLKEDDYAGAFNQYVQENTAENLANAENIVVTPGKDITVGDSIDYITHTLTQEYLTILADKKALWEKKQADCELDEKANIGRYKEYMKKYEDMKRKHGNDIQYRSKIEGYKKAADRLPSNHEEYLEFDRRRTYSFSLDAEKLKADYEAFEALGAEAYIQENSLMLPYKDADRNTILATIAEVSYTQAGTTETQATYIFGHKPMRVIGEFDNTIPNILEYNNDVAQ